MSEVLAEPSPEGRMGHIVKDEDQRGPPSGRPLEGMF